MSRLERINSIITQDLTPTHLEIIDQSEAHKGHKGSHNNGESHYQINIASVLFENKSKLDCHRLINGLLKQEFESGLHALSIKILDEKDKK